MGFRFARGGSGLRALSGRFPAAASGNNCTGPGARGSRLVSLGGVRAGTDGAPRPATSPGCAIVGRRQADGRGVACRRPGVRVDH